MDKKFRKAATASTCYEKFSGSFLPIFDSKSKNFENCFKLEYKDKNQYIKADSINDNTITEYSHIILDYLKNNKSEYWFDVLFFYERWFFLSY